MGVETTTTITVTCDNPACPGNSLDPASYEGWIQIMASVTPPAPEGQFAFPVTSPTQYFCSPSCAASVEQKLIEEQEAREAAANQPEIDNSLPV